MTGPDTHLLVKLQLNVVLLGSKLQTIRFLNESNLSHYLNKLPLPSLLTPSTPDGV